MTTSARSMASSLPTGGVAKLFKGGFLVEVGGQHGPAPFEIGDLAALFKQRSPLVERYFLDTESFPIVSQQPGQRLPDGSGTNDVDNLAQNTLLVVGDSVTTPYASDAVGTIQIEEGGPDGSTLLKVARPSRPLCLRRTALLRSIP